MKNILILFCIITSLNLLAQQDVLIKVDDVANKLKDSNLELYAGATQVYNAKQRIKFARNSLLPKLNIWRLASVLVDWKAAGEVLAQDLVPFLVPANWQRVKESKLLGEATNEGFHGLQKNTIFQTKLMYFQLQQEIFQNELQREYLSKIDKILVSLSGQTHFNNQINQWFRDLSYKKTLIEFDIIEMNKLISEERQQLSLALGLNSKELMMPEKLESNFGMEIQDYSDADENEEDVLFQSCELKEFDYVLKAAPKVKKEINWNVLGVSDISRGAAGGVFDDIPIQDGLGFGMGSSLKIHKQQIELLKKQREGVSQILLRQIQSIAYKIKLLEQQHKISLDKLELLEQDKEQMQLRFTLGANFNPVVLADLEQRFSLAKISIANISLTIKSEHEKLKRLFEKDEYKIH